MAITQQIDEFTSFAQRLAEQPGNHDLSLDEVIDKWQSINHDDVAAIREALASYDAGERGIPVRDFLAERRAIRAKKSS